MGRQEDVRVHVDDCSCTHTIGKGGQYVKIAVLDSMIYFRHDQLENRFDVLCVWQGYIDDFSEC